MRRFTFGALAATLLSGLVSASTVYSTSAPQFIGTNISDLRVADSFVLGSSATLTSVMFYGSVFSGTFAGNFDGSVTYAFYNDSSGALGSVISTGTVGGLTGVSAGTCGAGQCDTVTFTLNSPVSLAAGTYWLEIHEGTALTTSDGSAITWAGFNAATGTSLLSLALGTAPNTSTAGDRSFSLFDTSAPVPEPSSALLVVGGAGAMAFYRRRKRAV